MSLDYHVVRAFLGPRPAPDVGVWPADVVQ